jgi:hypothetical protein
MVVAAPPGTWLFHYGKFAVPALACMLWCVVLLGRCATISKQAQTYKERILQHLPMLLTCVCKHSTAWLHGCCDSGRNHVRCCVGLHSLSHSVWQRAGHCSLADPLGRSACCAVTGHVITVLCWQ